LFHPRIHSLDKSGQKERGKEKVNNTLKKEKDRSRLKEEDQKRECGEITLEDEWLKCHWSLPKKNQKTQQTP
jgi:hypothetical protein